VTPFRIGCAAALGALHAIAPAGAQEPPVFRSSVEAVYVDAFVTDRGRALSGLAEADFDLKDNGVPQQIELMAAESLPLTVVLVFDTSSSVVGDRLRALRAASEMFLGELRSADQAALVTFSEEIAWLAGPTADKSVVRSTLARLHPEGATAVFDALYASLVLADRCPRALIVLFTDGQDNTSVLDEAQIRVAAQRSNALIHVVGWSGPEIGGPNAPEMPQVRALREIAEATGGRFWTAGSPAHLEQAFADIARAMSQRYILRYEPSGVERSGWHRLDVRVRGTKARVQARRGYWVPPR
jgi:Ca-activated chloride channel homolog